LPPPLHRYQCPGLDQFRVIEPPHVREMATLT